MYTQTLQCAYLWSFGMRNGVCSNELDSWDYVACEKGGEMVGDDKLHFWMATGYHFMELLLYCSQLLKVEVTSWI